MADETSKNYVLNLDVNTTKFIQEIKRAEDATSRMQKTLGDQGKSVSKLLGGAGSSFKQVNSVVDSTTGKLKNMGKEVASSATKVKLANGTIGTYTETVKQMKDGTKQVTGAFKQAGTSTDSFVQRLGMLAKRAVGVVLVWSTLRAIMMSTTRLFKSSIKFLIDWEYQLAQIAIVGNSTKESLSTLSGALIQVGKDFGISIKDLGEASKLWSQQGRAIEEIIPLMRTTAKLSLVTGQTTSQAVEDLTAVLKAYRIEAKNSINIVDSMTNVMTKHAITAKDLASAYKQVASTASSLGVSFDELTGYITAIKAVTRDSGSKIGLSLRTMFSRITTSSAKAIQNISSVPLYLDSTGRATFAVTPRIRALGDIIGELSLKFGALGNAQRSQLASLIGGVRRQNQVFALFDNFTESVKAQTDSLFGLGKAGDAISILTNTSKIGIEQLKNAWFSFVESVGNSDVIKDTLTSLTELISALDKALAPDKFAYKESLDSLNKQNDKYARQIKLANAIQEIAKQTAFLEDQSLRASEEQNKVINSRADLYRKSLNEASALAGVNFKVNETGGLAGLGDEIDALGEKAKELNIASLVGQQLIALRTEALSAGQSIGQVLDELAVKKISIAGFSVNDKEVKDELNKAYNIFKNTAKAVKVGSIIPEADVKKIAKISKEWKLLADDEQAGLERLLELYVKKLDLSTDNAKAEEFIVNQLEAKKEIEQDIELIQKQEVAIAQSVVKHQLARMKLAGATASEILKAEGYLNKQLGIEEKIESRLDRQLALERAKTEEKRLQGKLGSDSIKLFEIAKEHGTDVAKKIGDVLAGNVDFSTFAKKGGKELDAFKDKFANLFKQKQAEAFFKGEKIPGEGGFNFSTKRLSGGAGIDIQEDLTARAKRYSPEAEILKKRLFAQEQAVITPKTIVTAPVKVDFITNINVSELSELVGLVITGISKQLPQAGTVINKALKSALYNKQTGPL